MWRFPEEVLADLNSKDPGRIAASLRDIKEASQFLDEFEIPPIDIALLIPFGETPPPDVLHTFARVLADYRSFQPPLRQEEILYRLAELSAVYADDRVAMDASMELKIAQDPPAMVARVLDRLRDRGLRNDREVLGAGRYLSYLLDGKPEVREATISALKSWRGGLLDKAVDFIRPQLEDHELQQLAG
jgi:AcrR family transcriptional regulator